MIRWISLICLALAFVVIQALIGGARMVFSLPGYLLIGLAGFLLLFSRTSGRISRPAWLCFGITLCFGGYIIGRSLVSPVEYLARTDGCMAAGALLVYGMTALYFTDPKSRLVLVSVFFVCAIVHVLAGAIQFRQADNFMLIPGIFRPNYEWRASGFYICPNHLAGLLEMVGLMAFSLGCWARCGAGIRILLGYCAVVCIAGIAITGSRGGYLCTILGLLAFAGMSLWVVCRVRPDRFALLSVFFVAGLALLLGSTLFVMVKSDILKARVAQLYEPTNMRLHLWQTALRQFQLSPVAGTGSGTYLFLGRQLRSPLVQNDPMHAHCDYLELLAEYGIIGAMLAAGFLVLHLKCGFAGVRDIVKSTLETEWRTSSNQLALNVGALSGIIALLGHSIVDFNFHIPANTMVAAFLFGIVARPALRVREEPGESPRESNGGWLRWFAPMVGVLVIVLAARRMPGEFFAERARIALRNKQFLASERLAEEGLAWERKNPDLFYYLAEAARGRASEESSAVIAEALSETSATALESGLKLFPQDTRLLLKLGEALDSIERFEEANAIFQRAIANDPSFGNVYAYYGFHWLAQHRLEEARRYLSKAQDFGGNQLGGSGLQQIDALEKNPMAKGLLEFLPARTEEPAGSPILPRR